MPDQVAFLVSPPPGSKLLGIRAKSLHKAGAKGRNQAPASGSFEGKKLRIGMLRTAQSILYRPDLPAPQQHRTCWCYRTVRSASEQIEIYRAKDGSNVRLVGLSTCSNVWTCPVCSARITEQRRVELQAAMVNHTARGGHAYLLTLTFPHQAVDGLSEMLDRFAAALTRYKNSRAYKAVMEKYGRDGSVRSLEVTYGENGFHPHTHDLVFAQPGLDQDAAALNQLRSAWIKALLNTGLATVSQITALEQHSFDLRGGQYAAEYVAKFGRDHEWGMSSEITRGRSKAGVRTIGGNVHVTPFQLLAWAHEGDYASRRLFLTYAKAFQGKRMLSWSRGLKEKLGVRDLSDDEIAATPLPEESRVGAINARQYAVITSRAALGDFLEYIATCVVDQREGQSDVDAWIAQLGDRPPSHSAVLQVRKPVVGRGYMRIFEGIDPSKNSRPCKTPTCA